MRSAKINERQGMRSNRFAWVPLLGVAVILVLLMIPPDRLFGCPLNDYYQKLSKFTAVPS